MQGTRVGNQAHKRSGSNYRWLVLLVAIFGTFMSSMDQTIVNIAIPQIQNALGTDIHSVQWVLTGYILAQGIGTPTTAFFAETLGVKRFYMFSIALFTGASILCGLAWSLPILITFRIIQGLSEAGLVPMSLAMIFRVFPREQRGLAGGIFGTPVLLAPVIAPTLGGYLVSLSGWQLIFFVNIPVGILGIVLAALILREVLGSLGGGLLALIIFVAFEISSSASQRQLLLDLRIFSNAPFSTAVLANSFIYFVMFGGGILLQIYLQNLRGLNALQAGLYLLPSSLVSVVSLVIGGMLVDRLGGKIVTIVGLLVIGFATWRVSFVTLDTPWWSLQLLLMLRNTSLGFTVQPLSVVAQSEISSERQPLASAVSTLIRSVSSSLGIAVLTTIVQTQSQVHYSHLSEQVTPGTPPGQQLLSLQAFFVSRGASLDVAREQAVQLLVQLVQRQGSLLAIQDAFFLSTICLGIALIATLFVVEHHGSGNSLPI
jgi:MFS family permease